MMRLSTHTWADAFGRWHARVTVPADMPPISAEGEQVAVHDAAHHAIAEELRERGAATEQWLNSRFHVDQVEVLTIDDGKAYEFVERTGEL